MNIDEKLRLLAETGSLGNESLLTEAYLGKHEVLLECEKLLDAALNNKVAGSGAIQVKQVEVLLQKFFNFRHLVLAPFSGILGATMPVSLMKFESIFKKPRMEKSKATGGVQFRTADKVDSLILIDLGTAAKLEWTGAELLSIILHEIGHSMRVLMPATRLKSAMLATTLSTKIISDILFIRKINNIPDMFKGDDIKKLIVKEKVALVRNIAGIVLPVYATKYVGKANDKINMFIDKYSVDFKENAKSMSIMMDIVNFVMVYHDKIKSFMSYVKNNKVLKWFTEPIYNYFNLARTASDPLLFTNKVSAMAVNILTMKEETFADYIAAIYGYGVETQTALQKYDTYKRTFMFDNPITRFINLPFNIINSIMDPHPKNITRVQLLISNLETELSKGMNKDHYKQIEKDLVKAKEVLEEVKTSMNKSPYLNFDLIIYRKIMDKLVKGHDDIRAVFFGLTPGHLKKFDGLVELPVQTKDPETLNETTMILNESVGNSSDQSLRRLHSYLLSESFDNTLDEMIDFWKE